MIFPSKVSGIPCQVEVTEYTAYEPAQTMGPPDRCYPAEGGELSFDILDRRGRPAPWLINKLTDADKTRIEEEIHIMYEGEKASAFEPPY